MVLRPATPLAAVLLVAFALLLLSTISAPVIKAVPLGTHAGTNFGVFGTCKGDTCSSFGVGYDVSPDNSANSFSFKNANTRRTLSSILILHPVAALLTLVCFACSIAAHFHKPAHSARFLLGLVLLMIPTFLISLLAFVIDLILFLPNAAWGAWITLGATVLIFVSGVFGCAMRRTTRSRKEQRKRIAENAEMSGENFYGRQRADSPPPLPQPPVPMVNGAPGADKLPGFAVYDSKSAISNDDDRTPLNNSRTATGVSGGSSQPAGSEDGMERYGRGGSSLRGRGGRPGYNGPRDEFGNPLPPAGFGPDPVPMQGDYMRRPSQDSQRSNRSRGSRGGYGPRGGMVRGRGGPPRGRGGPMRGGPMGPQRGGPMGGRGGGMGMAYGGGPGPDQGYGQAYVEPAYGPPQGQGYGQAYGGPSPYAQGRQQSPGPPSAPGYGRQPSPGPPSNPGMRNRSPGPPSAPGGYAVPYGAAYAQSRPESLARADSPPPLPTHDMPGDMPPDLSSIGQAVEMNHLTGSPANTPGFVPPPHPFRDDDSEVQGLVGMQQARQEPPMSPTSLYSTQRTDAFVSPLMQQSRFNPAPRHNTPPLQTIVGSPAMAAARQSPAIQHAPAHLQPSRARVSGDNYYEDVDPRFDQEHMAKHNALPQQTPTSLMPGSQPQLMASPSYDSVNEGPASDSSHFTSISERGINPAWRPDHGSGAYGPGGVPHRGPPPPQQQQRDFLLSGNPDFELGRSKGATGARGAPGMF